ncbi:MAG: TlpA disulfide reductase family protein [Bacteroidota bacterium]
MKRFARIVFIFTLLIQTVALQAAPGYETFADSIDIQGKFPDSCAKPAYVFITKYNNPAADVGRVPVNAKGEFTYRMLVEEAGEIVFRDGKYMYDFIATGNQKNYLLQISCTTKTEKQGEVINSPENDAYKHFYALRKQLKADLDTFKTQDLGDKKVFKEFHRLMSDYQKQIAMVAKQHPGTFTTGHLIAADRLAAEDLTTITALREKFIHRECFADPYLYNTFLAPRLLTNYMDFVRDKNDTSFAPFERLLLLASKNTDAAKRLQLILYDLLFKRHEEVMLKKYGEWAQANPDKMVQLIIKSRLERITKCLTGNPFVDVQLRDTAGAVQKLSQTVASAKLTLLIFYSPGCSHCKELLPQLVPLWDIYKDKGLKIFTVGSDANRDEWLAFIKEHTGNGWVNVTDTDNTYNMKYVVSSTPAFVLIDEAGKIISRLATHEFVKTKIPIQLGGR